MKPKLTILELFAGTRCISKAFEKRGHQTFSVEWSKEFENIDLYDDVNNLTPEIIYELCKGKPNVIWASPDCTSYSVAGIRYHRRKNQTGELEPISDYAKFCDKTNSHLVWLIDEVKPDLYFIENPRGALRKMKFMQELPRYTVTYCQYGDKRMKPTDIWTNHPDPKFKPMCKCGDSCHEPSPRGEWRTGTQGIRGSRERSKIPEELCQHIVKICEEYHESSN